MVTAITKNIVLEVVDKLFSIDLLTVFITIVKLNFLPINA